MKTSKHCSNPECQVRLVENRNWSGRGAKCDVCRITSQRISAKKNKEVNREKKNEQHRIYNAEWRAKPGNMAKLRKAVIRWNEANPDKIAEYNANYIEKQKLKNAEAKKDKDGN